MSDFLPSLADVVDALTNPSQHRTPRHKWSTDRRNRNKIRLKDHVVVLPGLLTQLAALAFPLGVDGEEGAGGQAIPQSRPPGNPRALTAWLDIHIAATRWTVHLGVGSRDTMTGMVRGLLGGAPGQAHTTQRDLLNDMNGWRARCEEIAGWTTPDPVLTVPCPTDLCGYRTLRVDVEQKTARCMSCGSEWAEQETDTVGSLAVLGRYVTRYRARASDAADAVRAEVRRRKAADAAAELRQREARYGRCDPS